MQGPMERDHGRGQRRGRARRVRQAGPRHHARPAQEREDGQRARGPAPRSTARSTPSPPSPPTGAELTLPDDLPDDLRAGFAQPGRTYPATVRFSNAAGTGQPDTKPDLRGVALRVQVSPTRSRTTCWRPTSRSPTRATPASSSSSPRRPPAAGSRSCSGSLRLIRLFGPRETVRMLQNVLTARGRTVSSVATETYWSRGAIRVGADPGGALPAAARAGHGAGPAPADRRPGLPLDRGRPPARAGVTSASSCASSATSTRSRRRSRTPRSRGRSGSRPPSRWPC